jgi:hypothetical protein
MPTTEEVLAELQRDPAYAPALGEFQADLPSLARR